tara:strand:+ start:198 stop:431 length:234 start_codon:yes stop_codon:yes gene_type:complete
MKRIAILLFLLLFLSCSSLPFMNNNNSNNNSPSNALPERIYIDTQIKLHTAYSLFKALNAGVITQEEYGKLKAQALK